MESILMIVMAVTCVVELPNYKGPIYLYLYVYQTSSTDVYRGIRMCHDHSIQTELLFAKTMCRTIRSGLKTSTLNPTNDKPIGQIGGLKTSTKELTIVARAILFVLSGTSTYYIIISFDISNVSAGQLRRKRTGPKTRPQVH